MSNDEKDLSVETESQAEINEQQTAANEPQLDVPQQSAPLTEEQKKAKKKKVINIIFTAVQIALVVITIIFSVFLFISPSAADSEVKNTPLKFLIVLSDSMDGGLKEGEALVDPWNVAYAERFANYTEADKADPDLYQENVQVQGQTVKLNSFTVNDLLLGKVVDFRELELGDVIAYKGHLKPTDKEYAIISHRIVAKDVIHNSDGTVTYNYQVIGDNKRTEFNSLVGDQASVWANLDNRTVCSAKYDAEGKLIETDIQCKITGILKNTGAFIKWMQPPSANFLLVILIPLGILFIYNAYLFIRMIMDEKIRKLQLANQSAVQEAEAKAQLNEEEIKQKAIEEYLRQQREKEQAENADVKKPTDSNDGENND